MLNINKVKIFIIFICFSFILVLTNLVIEKIYFDITVKKQVINEAPEIVENKINIFNNFTSEAKNDLLSIRNSNSIKNYLDDSSNLNNLENLQNLFMALANSNSIFMQIRFLDKNGHEIVKVIREDYNNKVKIVSKNKLQNKANRYYFNGSKNLNEEKIQFSALDLNSENGKIETPFKSTLRSYMPVIKNNIFEGVIIINYFAKELLNNVLTTPLFNVVLADELGYIIKHYDGLKDWGFYKKEKYNISKEYPQLYNEIISKETVKSDNFYSKTLDLGLNDYLYIILEVNNEFIVKQEKSEFKKNLILSTYYFLISIIFSFIIIKLFSNLFLNLSQQKQINERLENASKASKIGFWEYQPKSKIFYWNKSINKIFSIKNTDLDENDRILPLIPIDDKQKIYKLFLKSIKNKLDFSYISEHKSIKENSIYVEHKGKHFFNKEGKHIQSLGSICDVTEKIINEKLQKQLLKQTKEFKKLFSRFDENVIASATNTKGIITYVSKAFCEISGFTRDELIGSPQNIVRHPDTSKEIFINLWETIKSGNIWHGELKNKTKNGGFYWVYAIIYPEFDDENNIIGFSAIRHDLTSKKEFEGLLEETNSSIKYASFIQSSLIPKEKELKTVYKNNFIIWEPKDIVGGDIILFNKLNENESLLMVIDCTGHGVPGAFVSMLVKAIEKQIITEIMSDKTEDISPALILESFNKNFKEVLKQEKVNDHINIGFDGTAVYYNKKLSYIKFASANSSLIYNDNNEIKTVKGDRFSIGYKKSDINHHFNEHKINVNKGMKFYLFSDGYIDQIGGEKGFSLSKSKFVNIIKSNINKPMEEQKMNLKKSLLDYQNEYKRVDDVTVVGIEI